MAVPEALLSLLAQRQSGAYQLRQHFMAATNWKINIGQVYQTLRRLERDGLIKPIEIAGNADYFAVTAKGKQAVTAWLTTPLAASHEERDELTMKIMVAAHTGANLQAVIQQQRKATLSQLRALTRRKAASSDLTETLLLERHIFALDATSRWLDHIEPLAIQIAQQAQQAMQTQQAQHTRAIAADTALTEEI